MTNSTLRPYLTPALFFLIAVLFSLPFLIDLTNWGIRDWDRALVMAAIPGDAIFHYGQFPFWNPYIAGGNIFFHHPEALVLSPFLLLYLIFGPVIGLKLQLSICYFIGLWGSYRFAERIGLSALSSFLVSTAYFGSVYFALHFAEGHVMFGDFALLPWILLFLLDSLERRSRLIWAALLIALMILGNGGAVPLMYTALFCGLFFLLHAIEQKSFKPVLHTLAAFAGGMFVAAVKFLPMLVYLFTNEWEGAIDERIPLSALGDVFFSLKQSLFLDQFDGQVWAWHEYGAYISPILIVVAVIGVAVQFRKRWPWLALLLFFLLLGLGNFGFLSPWNLLSHLPGFSYARCTGRAFQFVILSTAIFGGFGLDWLIARLRVREKRLAIIPYIVPAVVLITNFALDWSILSDVFKYPPVQVERSETFSQVIDNEMRVYRNFLANRGSLVAPMISVYKPSRALVGPRDSVMSEHLVSGVTTLLSREYTPNRITYQLAAHTGGELAISMGYDPGWEADNGRTLGEFLGLLKIPFSPGEQTITLTYRPPWIFTGLVISLLSILLCIVLIRKIR